MALIACPECGNEVSDRAPTCPRCGVPILVESKVVVYGYTQQFAVNPKVQVFWNGDLVGSVKKGEVVTIDIDDDGDVSFKSSMRKASVRVQAGRVTNIKISWDRITGKMIPGHRGRGDARSVGQVLRPSSATVSGSSASADQLDEVVQVVKCPRP